MPAEPAVQGAFEKVRGVAANCATSPATAIESSAMGGLTALQTALDRLRAARLSLTGRRKQILRILAESPRPLTAREIGERLSDAKDCDPGTICRCLRVFERAGIVSRLGFGANKAGVYEIRGARTPQSCLVTRDAIDGAGLLEGPELEQLRAVIAKVYDHLTRRGYRETSHVVQFVARPAAADRKGGL